MPRGLFGWVQFNLQGRMTLCGPCAEIDDGNSKLMGACVHVHACQSLPSMLCCVLMLEVGVDFVDAESGA